MATDLEWEVIARRWDPASRSCILELRDRIEALEAAQNLRQQDEDVERVAGDPPIATDEELEVLWNETDGGMYTAFRTLYDLGRQHGAAANSKPTPNFDQIRSSADTGLLPMIVSETGSDDEPETERIICSAISGGADYVNGMPRELSLERIRDGDSISARYVQAPLEVAGPAPAPAVGLVERLGSVPDVWSAGKALQRLIDGELDSRWYVDLRRARSEGKK